MVSKRSRLGVPYRPLTAIAALLVSWWLVNVSGLVNPLFLPNLRSVLYAIGSQLSALELYRDALATTYRSLTGLAISMLVAVPLGLLFGRVPVLFAFFELPVDFFRSIPSSALFFLFILVFGIGDGSKIAVVVYGCSLVMLVNTIYGVKPTREKQDRINMLRAYRASSFQIYYLAVVRDALPHITAGIRVCVSLSFVLVVVTEMFLSATAGLGRRIYDFYLAYRVSEMYAAIIILGVLGFVINHAFVSVERRICFWLPS